MKQYNHMKNSLKIIIIFLLCVSPYLGQTGTVADRMDKIKNFKEFYQTTAPSGYKLLKPISATGAQIDDAYDNLVGKSRSMQTDGVWIQKCNQTEIIGGGVKVPIHMCVGRLLRKNHTGN